MNKQQTDLATLILRLSLGTMFIAHAMLKIMVFTLPGTVGFFESVGFPGWMAYLVVAAELGGGILLLLGIETRKVAYALIPVLLGAAYVHMGNGWVFSNANGGWEYPLFLIAATFVQALLGSGRYAIKFPGTTQAVNA